MPRSSGLPDGATVSARVSTIVLSMRFFLWRASDDAFHPAHGAKRSGQEPNILRISNTPLEFCVSTATRRKEFRWRTTAKTRVGRAIEPGPAECFKPVDFDLLKSHPRRSRRGK